MLKRKSGDGMAEVLNQAIEKIRKDLETGALKGSVSDLIRLMQLRNEIKGSRPQQVTARWVDECRTPASEE